MSESQNDIVPVALPAPGWYPDPGTPTMTRWWSGDSWTEYVAPLEERPAPPETAAEASADSDPDQLVVGDPAPTDTDTVAPDATDPAAQVDPADPGEQALFAPNLAVTPEAAAAEQQSWHSRRSGASTPRRGEVATGTATRASTRRPASDYQPNWIAGVAFVLAVISIPVVAVRVLMDLPPLTQSLAASAPIAIALLALVTSVRRGGRGILLSIVAVVLCVATLAAGFLLPRDVVQSVTDIVLGYLNIS